MLEDEGVDGLGGVDVVGSAAFFEVGVGGGERVGGGDVSDAGGVGVHEGEGVDGAEVGVDEGERADRRGWDGYGEGEGAHGEDEEREETHY